MFFFSWQDLLPCSLLFSLEPKMSVSEERKTIKMRGGCHGNYKIEAETLQSRRGRGTDLVAARGRAPVQAGVWYLVRKVACGLRGGGLSSA